MCPTWPQAQACLICGGSKERAPLPHGGLLKRVGERSDFVSEGESGVPKYGVFSGSLTEDREWLRW